MLAARGKSKEKYGESLEIIGFQGKPLKSLHFLAISAKRTPLLKPDAAIDIRIALEELSQRFALSDEVHAFATNLLLHATEHAEEIDTSAAAMAKNWSWERIARIDRLILRLALAEMLYIEEIPVRVSINEAIELAKSYSTDKSYAFVNGVLDGVVRQKGLVV